MAIVQLYLAARTSLPSWLQDPDWLSPQSRIVGHFVRDHQTIGLLLVVFAEELGIPLPVPGDVAVALGGYLTTTGAIPLPLAYVAVVSGATIGSFCLYGLSRRFGHPFLLRFGRYIGLHEDRLQRAEVVFRRWGPWAIIFGRHIPGLRIVLSALSGILEVPARVFVPCVAVSSALWAAIFINLGRVLGRRVLILFRLLPVHLVPFVIVALAVLVALYVAWKHGWKTPAPEDRPNARPSALRRLLRPHSGSRVPREM